MLKKVILRLLSICLWMYSIVFLMTLIIVMVTQDDFTFVHFILFAIMVLVFGFFGRITWKKSRSNSVVISKTTKTTNIGNIASVTVTGIRDVPLETLTDMKHHYNQMQIEGDLRILNDSVKLLKTTKNIDTFVSRYELAQKTALTLEQAKKAKIRIPEKFISSQELLDLRYELVPKLLQDSFNEMKDASQKLKTRNGQLNRWKKYYELLIENDFLLDDFKEYEDIKKLLEKELASSQ